MQSPDNIYSLPRRVSIDALLLCAALICAWLEAMLPTSPLPGFKLGLPNLVVMITAAIVSRRDAFIIQLSRIIIIAFLFGNAAGFLFSLAGGLLSTVVISLLVTHRRLISLVGISILSAAAHNTGQVIAACILLGRSVLGMYSWLLILSIPTGVVTGVVAELIVSRLKPENRFSDTNSVASSQNIDVCHKKSTYKENK